MCRERPWLDDRSEEVEAFFQIRVGDINYEIPLKLTPDEVASIRAEKSADGTAADATAATASTQNVDTKI